MCVRERRQERGERRVERERDREELEEEAHARVGSSEQFLFVATTFYREQILSSNSYSSRL